jgi:hypothetical protein
MSKLVQMYWQVLIVYHQKLAMPAHQQEYPSFEACNKDHKYTHWLVLLPNILISQDVCFFEFQ